MTAGWREPAGRGGAAVVQSLRVVLRWKFTVLPVGLVLRTIAQREAQQIFAPSHFLAVCICSPIPIPNTPSTFAPLAF